MTVRRLLLIPVMVLAVFVGAVPPVTALICMRHPGDTHLAIAAGTDESVGDGGFFERWHHLLLARVVGVTTDDDERSPTRGRTRWAVEVRAALGEARVPALVEVNAHDPGWLSGYAFRVGDAYAIPVGDIDGLGSWSSFACDPIIPLGDLDAAVDEVLAVAADSGTPIASVDPSGSGVPDRGPVAEPDRVAALPSDGGGPWAVPAAVAAAAVAAGGGGVVLWRRRRGSQDT